MKTILVPVDFSPVTEPILKEAALLTEALDGQIILLTVVQPPLVLSEYAGMIDISRLAVQMEKNASRQLATLEMKLKKQSIKTRGIQLTGSAIPIILEQANMHEADYIVMGSHGHTAFYDLLVGSTTHGVLMRAKCPVVVVPAAKHAAAKQRRKKRSSVR